MGKEITDICIECKSEVTWYASTPFCKSCSTDFYADTDNKQEQAIVDDINALADELSAEISKQLQCSLNDEYKAEEKRKGDGQDGE